MGPYLTDLLRRMRDDSYLPGEEKIEGVFESEKTVYANAYDEARLLTDLSLLPQLFEVIKQTPIEEEKRCAIFIVGFISKNTSDILGTEFLLNCLRNEKKTHTITLILDRLAHLFKPSYLDLSIIKQLIEKRGSLIRRRAYYALTNSAHGVEEYLLSKLADTKIPEDSEAIIGALGYIGTIRSAKALAPLMKSRKFIIKHAVQSSLSTIMVRHNFPITEICRVTKVSTSFVNHSKDNITRLTRPA